MRQSENMAFLDEVFDTFSTSKFLLFFLTSLIIITIYLILSTDYKSLTQESFSKKKEKNSPSSKERKTKKVLEKSHIKSLSEVEILKNSFSENNYTLTNIEDVKILSKESFNYYKDKLYSTSPIINKDKELSFMLIESLSSLNCSKSNVLENSIFNKVDWCLEQEENRDGDEEYIVSNYIYPNDKSLITRKMSSLSSSLSSLNSNLETDCEEIEKEKLSLYKLGIMRTFDQSEEFKLKSNLVKEVNGKFFKVYSQGDPELIKKICKKESLPSNYDEIINDYEKKGLKLIGLSGKMMKMTYLQSQKISRGNCESNMTFLGFISTSFESYKNAYS